MAHLSTPKLKASYRGRLNVDPPDEFRITANTLTLREIEGHLQVAFDFHYVYHGAPDRFEGTAYREAEGYYVSPQKDGQTIYILKMPSPENEHYFEGFWAEETQGAWKISGVLEERAEA